MKPAAIIAALILVAVAAVVLTARARRAVETPSTPVARRVADTPQPAFKFPPAPAVPARARPTDPEEDTPFRFDDRTPLREQLRTLLGAVCPLEPPALAACRERSATVVPALRAILRDVPAGPNVRDQALGLLAHLGASDAVPDILDLARNDVDPTVRTSAIGTLADFPELVASSDLLGIFDAARTPDEKFRAVTVLGTLGDAKALPFLEELARSAPDSLMIDLATQAAMKVKVRNSPHQETELVQLLHEEDHPLQEWALSRIAVDRRTPLVHHLRRVLDQHRKLPRNKINASFQFQLLVGIRDLGQELSPQEKAFVAGYSIENDRPLPD